MTLILEEINHYATGDIQFGDKLWCQTLLCSTEEAFLQKENNVELFHCHR